MSNKDPVKGLGRRSLVAGGVPFGVYGLDLSVGCRVQGFVMQKYTLEP